MMSGEVTRCLSIAVGAWCEAWLAVKGKADVDLEHLFHRPLEMLQHLLLTALMCSAHSEVSYYTMVEWNSVEQTPQLNEP